MRERRETIRYWARQAKLPPAWLHQASDVELDLGRQAIGQDQHLRGLPGYDRAADIENADNATSRIYLRAVARGLVDVDDGPAYRDRYRFDPEGARRALHPE